MQSPRNGAALPRPEFDMERRKREAVAGAIAAIQALRNGEQHERISTMIDRTTERLQRHHADLTSQRPTLPRIIVTEPVVREKWYGDYTDRRQGAGGADRQE
ncbi:hypothetical protein [Mixta calida]|uniref:hypothetical protein n=1 Tax=Mixta calida TaxID=665913 RepID=UPI002FDE7107